MSMFIFLFTLITTLLNENEVSTKELHTSSATVSQRIDSVELPNTTNKIVTATKWQINRVNLRRYEIINVLRRKTKLFGDVITPGSTTTEQRLPNRSQEKRSILRLPKHNLPYLKTSSSTPSNIEFYYDKFYDEVYESKKSEKLQSNMLKEKHHFLYSPVFVFHVQYETCKSTKKITKSSQTTPTIGFHKNIFMDYIKSALGKKMSGELSNELYSTRNYDNETCPVTIEALEEINVTLSTVSKILTNVTTPQETTMSSTENDRIKFFEMYDNDTPIPKIVKKISNSMNDIESIDYDEKILLENINLDMRNSNLNKTRYVKKHANTFIPTGSSKEIIYLYNSPKVFSTSKTSTQSFNTTKHSYISRTAVWSDFPFVAVYVYEPYQVHCDAAAISPHWLLASASCLSRHNKNTFSVDSQSAYVVYCSDNWKNSERITYVKHTFIHPRFHKKDGAKRHLYNIGIIQIVNSMAETCNGWSPISLMSHQMAGNPHGVKGVAVGWGLDRYDVKTSKDIKYSLMLYQGLVYSETCPGFSIYKNGRRYKKINNVYCLSLPEYGGEVNDPVHGAMLLIGGKLIALYLQEERRPSGEQSALYTGVWRHIPWILDIAREPDDFTYAREFS